MAVTVLQCLLEHEEGNCKVEYYSQKLRFPQVLVYHTDVAAD
jgi:hypothetical protein